MLKRVFPYHLKEMRPGPLPRPLDAKKAKRDKRECPTIVLKSIERGAIGGKKEAELIR